MLVISGCRVILARDAQSSFNLAIEMLVISGDTRFSHLPCRGRRFNLAIEMLVISGTLPSGRLRLSDTWFQSRNRDACHFRATRVLPQKSRVSTFQSRNRDACHFRAGTRRRNGTTSVRFQSRNRDACHFRGFPRGVSSSFSAVSISQSRCLSFQDEQLKRQIREYQRFNLAIEMLVISGTPPQHQPRLQHCFNLAIEMLVISG